MKIRAFPLLLVSAFILATLFATSHAQVQGCADYTDYLRWVAQEMPPNTTWSPQVNGVVVKGNLAYVAAYGDGLAIYDVTDPSNPNLLGMADTPYDCSDVALDGDYAYVADWHSPGFCVIDVSDPALPNVVGTAGDTPSPNYWKVAVANPDTVYVLDHYNGVRVVDVTDPTNPELVGLIGIGGYAWDLMVQGEYLYVVDDINGLHIFDKSLTAEEPEEVGRCDLPNYSHGVFVVGDYAYVACNTSGLQIIDVSDKEYPEVVGVLDSPDIYTTFFSVFVIDDLAYIICTGGSYAKEGLMIANVANPAVPYVINSLGFRYTYAYDLFVFGEHAYVGAKGKGFFVANVSNVHSPSFFSSYVEDEYFPRAVAASGDHAYVLDSLHGLRVFDITTPVTPTLVGNLDLPSSGLQIELVDDLAYVADGSGGLRVIDISTPSSPGEIGSVSPFGNQVDVAMQGDFAYVASSHMGMHVIDISSPASPTERGDIDLSYSNAVAVAVEGDYAYLACGFDGIYAINITNPDLPSETGHLTFEGDAINVAVARGHAFVSGYDDGVFVVDISNPAAMSLVSTLVTPGYVLDVIPDGDLAYIADNEGGLQIADYTDLANPRFLGSISTPNQTAMDLALVGTKVCVAEWEGGFHVLPKHCVPSGVPDSDLPAVAAPLIAYPNPFNPQTNFSFTLDMSTPVRITVYSPDGRPVRLLADRTFPGGTNTVLWNGRDDRGRGLPSGSYLVRVETASGIRQSKVTLLK
jgi:hypothetical protein